MMWLFLNKDRFTIPKTIFYVHTYLPPASRGKAGLAAGETHKETIVTIFDIIVITWQDFI